ncbi:hypothetical protein MVES1_003905 [Malassezia vespertilionis]|uniref:Eukaryotic membrane protein family-domain-containing protein n=1 Tax=Malassezia vespertilionis TaxID=2020962 RepID=A0A2N1J7N0_9BASI|nr:uncharacterized protein MVES1_003905 [Malassezia vespertilionis]PKI82561.1 hypothetical protein MVES_003459 [Malassezia vespertilionis]WFD08529.1 hypothetical protein MVES1_003905 [Malassezia vespertilionis]
MGRDSSRGAANALGVHVDEHAAEADTKHAQSGTKDSDKVHEDEWEDEEETSLTTASEHLTQPFDDAETPVLEDSINILLREREGMSTPLASQMYTCDKEREEPSPPTPVVQQPPPPAPTSKLRNTMYAVLVVLGVRAPPDYDHEKVHLRSGVRPFALHTPRAAVLSSLWDHLCDEVLVNSRDNTQELKWERVANFMAVPVWVEKTVLFGFLICLNSFLYTFTILPLRFLFAWWRWAYNGMVWLVAGEKRYLNVSHKCDMLKGLLIIQACFVMSRVADASKMYHSVRGQDVVKLSVIFSVLEIADRLCCGFGQDVLDSLFARRTLARRADGTQPYLRLVVYYVLCLAYIVFHAFVLLYQLVTLNVAINSYDNALLTLLLSNQFMEIKTTVFKRFEKEILFQITCADIVERFQLSMILTAIGIRNLIEVSGSQITSGTSSLGPLPTSFDVYPYLNILTRTLNPVLTVLLSEMLVDWLKHAFITKLNHIRPAIYGRFIDVLCRDLLPQRSGAAAKMDGDHRRQSSFVDQSPVVTRRLGLAVLPLACVLIRMASQIADMLAQTRALGDVDAIPAATATVTLTQHIEHVLSYAMWILIGLVAWVFLVIVKILLGVNLVQFATHRYATRGERELEEARNARGRPPIGETAMETALQHQIKSMVDKREDNATTVGLYGQQSTPAHGKETSLLDVNRYTLVGSRLW